MRVRISMAVVATAVGLLVAGCGDDEESTSTTTTTTEASGASGATSGSGSGLLPAEFIEQADAICKAGDPAIEKAFRSLGNPSEASEAEIESVITDRVVPEIRSQIEAIRQLDAPSEGAEELTTFLDDADAVVDEIEDDPSLLFEGSPQGNPFEDVNKQADELGLQECAD